MRADDREILNCPPEYRAALRRITELANQRNQRYDQHHDRRRRIQRRAALGRLDEVTTRRLLRRLGPRPMSAWRLWLQEQTRQPNSTSPDYVEWIRREAELAEQPT